MSDLLYEINDHICVITLNRIHKQNAFDDVLLTELHNTLEMAQQDPTVRVIILNANGRHFSAGADIHWMQRMVNFSEDENKADAMILARVMYRLHHSPVPTIAMVHGAAFGGGAGLVAACDIAIAAKSSQFCFSEVKLGLIPAIISPYVVRAIGERVASWLFMSAETIDAARACDIQLIHHCIEDENLLSYTMDYAHRIAQWAPQAVKASKTLVQDVAHRTINTELQHFTAQLIAQKRVSNEGQQGLQAFLNKKPPKWE